MSIIYHHTNANNIAQLLAVDLYQVTPAHTPLATSDQQYIHMYICTHLVHCIYRSDTLAKPLLNIAESTQTSQPF